MKIFIIAGEDSGDFLGSCLMSGFEKLSISSLQYYGVGGPLMTAKGLNSIFPMHEIALMGVTEILKNYFSLKKRINQVVEEVISKNPDVLITIDLPEFNLRVAKIVKQKIKVPIVHYVAPSVWAWRSGRAKKMASYIDHVLALLPFEPRFMKEAKMSCEFVGHPVVEQPLASSEDGRLFRVEYNIGDDPLLVCLPGSRVSEIRRLTPIFGETIKKLKKSFPNFRVVVPAAKTVGNEVREEINNWHEEPIFLDPGNNVQSDFSKQKLTAFRAADLALAASGTVSLELAANLTPMVMAYDMGWLSRQIIKRMVKIDTFTLVNIISETKKIPEFFGPNCNSNNLVNALTRVLKAPEEQRLVMKKTIKLLGLNGIPPGQRAAQSVIDFLENHKR